jgi:hypothetical protein
MKAALLALCALAAVAPEVSAQTTSTTFPFPPWHARTAGLGGVGAALGGLEFGGLNPAAYAAARGAQFSHHQSAAESQDGALSLAHGGEWGTISLSLQRRDWGAVAADLGLDDLSAGEQSLSVGYAARLAGPRLSFGAAVFRLDTDYLGVRSSGWALDAGIQARPGAGVQLGAALTHAGRLENDEGEEIRLPTRARVGAAWTARRGALALTTAADAAALLRASGVDLHLGSEATYARGAVAGAVRAGWRTLANPYGAGYNEGSWSVGAGAALGRIRADVARTTSGSLEDETFLSLSFSW